MSHTFTTTRLDTLLLVTFFKIVFPKMLHTMNDRFVELSSTAIWPISFHLSSGLVILTRTCPEPSQKVSSQYLYNCPNGRPKDFQKCCVKRVISLYRVKIRKIEKTKATFIWKKPGKKLVSQNFGIPKTTIASPGAIPGIVYILEPSA